ncbi:MAG TPA: histidine kinase [Usitatibacter sp.]|nr:histidine kinase [Usitatibacter sp.]
MKPTLFVLRRAILGLAFGGFLAILWKENVDRGPDVLYVLVILGFTLYAVVRAVSHVQRVRLVIGTGDRTALGSRHRRQIEVPFAADVAFAMVDAAIRELPHVDGVESARDSLQVRGRVKRMDPYLRGKDGERPARGAAGARRNLVTATVTPVDGSSSLTVICEPEGGAWMDWFMVDDGTNLENMEAIARAITRRVAERRRIEETQARDTETQKELTVAKLSLLHAQVEPHFLYNTLASAQVLTRTDPMRADLMLGHLIAYLRHSLPRTEDSLATLGEELERTRAYLEIMRIRMGERLAVQIQVPDELKGVALPPMMLQTLAENAIKHGLEPVPGGGTLWIIARASEGRVSITVADDGRGFSDEGGGTGIGLKNLRERLRLAYGDAAAFSIVANFPRGVAATIIVPAAAAIAPAAGAARA